MKKGVRNLVLTNSTQGVTIFSKEFPEGQIIPARRRKVTDSTGAGDALVSGMAYGLYHDHSLLKSVQIGLLISSLAVTSAESVDSRINETMIKNQIVRIFRIL